MRLLKNLSRISHNWKDWRDMLRLVFGAHMSHCKMPKSSSKHWTMMALTISDQHITSNMLCWTHRFWPSKICINSKSTGFTSSKEMPIPRKYWDHWPASTPPSASSLPSTRSMNLRALVFCKVKLKTSLKRSEQPEKLSHHSETPTLRDHQSSPISMKATPLNSVKTLPTICCTISLGQSLSVKTEPDIKKSNSTDSSHPANCPSWEDMMQPLKNSLAITALSSRASLIPAMEEEAQRLQPIMTVMSKKQSDHLIQPFSTISSPETDLEESWPNGCLPVLDIQTIRSRWPIWNSSAEKNQKFIYLNNGKN